MLIDSINTYALRIPFKIVRSTGYAILACLTLPFYLAGYKNFNYFRRKVVEIWNENKTKTTTKTNKFNPNKVEELGLNASPENIILDQWVANSSTEEEKEDRIAARQKIQFFFTEKHDSLSLSYSRLTSLPDIFNSSSFNNLRSLSLSNCESLTALPESLGNLSALEELDLSNCGNPTAGNLSTLKRLLFSNCKGLTVLPESLGNLSALKKLSLNNCRSLTALPESLDNLSALKKLDLKNCISLTALPESLGNLSALKELYLNNCRSLTTLPESIGNLSVLEELHLRDNQSLQGIPMQVLELPSNCTVDLTGCSLSTNTLERLREIVNSPNYVGPRISYSINDRINRREEKSIQESLKELYQIIGKKPKEFANLIKTEELRSWLNRLSDTADYKTGNGDLQKAFAEKIIAYLSQANENTEFRRAFNAIIEDASATCGDRIALSILHLSIAYQLATIDLKDMKKLADFLIKGPWAIQLLEEIARNKIPTLPFFDEIETYLGYPIKLKEELQIPIDVQNMLYFTCSALNAKDLEEAKNFVLNKQKEPFEFLVNNAKWQEALSANYSKEYQAILDEKAEAAEADDPDYTSIEEKYKQDLIELTKKVLES